MKFHILTLFPEMFRGFLDSSVIKRGQENGAIHVETSDIRDFSTDKNRKVDDTIFGGGAGMLLKPEPVAAAIRHAKEKLPNARVVYLSPSGEVFSQEKAEEIKNSGEDLILLCGRYEGIDQRVRATLVDEEISIGEYVLSGGELGAAVMVDTVSRLVPGVLGKMESVETESFSKKLFRSAEFPQFTRPEEWEGMSVPAVLKSGDHKKIEDWQLSHLPGLSETEERVLHIRRKKLPIKTRNLILRNHEESDIDAWAEWFNDEEVMKYMSLCPPLTRQDEEEYFEDAHNNLFMLSLSICDKKTKEPIGNMSLEIDPNKPFSAKFGIVIGEKNCWGKGVCKEAVREMVRIGFEEMELEKITLDVFTKNIAAQKCYENCGFVRVGESKKFHKKGDTFHDSFLYEVVKK
jgi:tRNA (guanine37-N1)-methyltransferase